MRNVKGVLRLAKNSTLLFILNFAVRLSSSILFLLLARFRDETAAGIFALAISYTLIIEALSLWGLDQILVRDAAHDRQQMQTIFPLFNGLRLLLSCVGVAGFMIFVVMTQAYSVAMTLVVLVIVLTVFTEGFNDISLALCVALDLVRVPALIGVCIAGLRLLLAGTLIITDGSLLLLAATLFCLSMLQTGVYIWFLRRHAIPVRPRFDRARLKTIFKTALPLGLINLIWALDAQGGVVFLSLVFQTGTVTVYNIATTVITALVLLPQAAQMALFPVLTRLYRTQIEQFKYWYGRLYTYLGAIGFGLALGVLVAAPGILFVFGAQYTAAIQPLQILGWTLVFYFLTIPNSRAMILADQLWVLVYLLMISLAVNWLFLFFTIDWLGVNAVALARVLALGVFFCLNHLSVGRLLWPVSLFAMIWRPLIAVACALGVWLLVQQSSWITQIFSVLGMYISSLIALQFHRRKELQRLLSLLRRRSPGEPNSTLEHL